MAGWRFRVDAGGTFTDGWAVTPGGEVRRAKVLSSSAVRGVVLARDAADAADAILVRGTWAGSPRAAIGLRLGWPGGAEATVVDASPAMPGDVSAGTQPLARLRLDGPPPPPGVTVHLSSPEPAAVLCARVLCDAAIGTPLPPGDFRVATTRATNALLERRGARVAVLVTRGFGDLPTIGDQRRPELFARLVRRPAPLHERVVELDERVAPDGTVERRLDEGQVAEVARRLRAEGIEAAAVCLLHAVRHPDHERRVAAILRDAGIEHVSTSVDGAARGPLVPRLATTIVDAFTGPVLTRHLERIAAAAGPGLRVLASDGGVRPASGFRSAEGLLSGPAGGVLAAAAAARRHGMTRAIGLDMGGTSTDACRIEGEPVLRGRHRVGDAWVLAPAMAIETVAAGGGSICRAEGGRLQVGPQSAGADPGPACHGGGGPLTLTDCTLLLGRLVAERFPFPPDVAAAERAAEAVLEAVRREDPEATRDAVLAGCCDLAAESMADAIRAVTVREGWDPADHALVAFGGAGGQHACAIADRLGITAIVFPADASILSAVGVHAARPRAVVRHEVLAAVEARTTAGEAVTAVALAAAEAEARRRLRREGVAPEAVRVDDRRLHARHPGQEATLEVPIPAGELELPPRLRERFAEVWRRTFGHDPADDRMEIESVEVRVTTAGEDPAAGVVEAATEASAVTSASRRRMHVGGRWRTVPVLERSAVAGLGGVAGPAIVVESRTSIVLEAGWRLEAGAGGDLVARRRPADDPGGEAASRPALVRRELTARRLRAVAEEMGEQLRRTSRSVNVRERLDFSCGVLDASGRLLASAPHVPVHLGALGACVRAVLAAGDWAPGDMVVVNHPAFGGSHLPDVTVLAPVDDAEGRRLGWVATRAHHAEIGGRRPGSMVPSARTLAEEGVVLPPMRIVAGGRDRLEPVAAMLRSGLHPSRRPADNLADLRAQIAACHRGIDGVRALAAAIGADALAVDAASMLAVSRAMVVAGLAALAGRTLEAADALDDGAAVRVRITVPPDPAVAPAVIDFDGSAGVHPGPFNAPRAVTASAVTYALRLLVDADVSLDDGLLAAVDLRIPPGMLDPVFVADPAACPAVAAGNVETSQRVVDVLVRALGLAAAGQGTMNNVLFGDESFSFYETVGGGAGATAEGSAAGGVHVHMSNTAITDPEILERRHPVRLERFALRPGSGGDGRHAGGEGLERIYRFTRPVRLSVLGSRRGIGPAGFAGGGHGAAGEQWLERAAGGRESLGPAAEADAEVGDRLVLRTPGGGGWGEPAGGCRAIASAGGSGGVGGDAEPVPSPPGAGVV